MMKEKTCESSHLKTSFYSYIYIGQLVEPPIKMNACPQVYSNRIWSPRKIQLIINRTIFSCTLHDVHQCRSSRGIL